MCKKILYYVVLLILFGISVFIKQPFNYHSILDPCISLVICILLPMGKDYIDKLVQKSVLFPKIYSAIVFTFGYYFAYLNLIHIRSWSVILSTFFGLMVFLIVLEKFLLHIKVTREDLKIFSNNILEKIELALPAVNYKKDYILFFAGFMFLILSFLYLENFVQHYYFIQDDNYAQFFPVILNACENFFREGIFPEINPYQLAGLPTSSAMVYSLTYPVTYIAYWVAENILKNNLLMLEVYALIHLSIAYILSYKSAKYCNVKQPFVFLFAICYSLAGYAIIGGRSWYYILPIVAYVPYTVIAIQNIRQHKLNFKNSVITALVLTLMLYSGNIQMFIYSVMFYCIGVFVLFILKEINLKYLIKSVIPLIFTLIFAMPQLYVLADLMRGIERTPWDLNVSTYYNLITFIIPRYILGRTDSVTDIGQTYYTGSIFFTISLFAVLLIIINYKKINKIKTCSSNLFLILGLLALIFSLGKMGFIWQVLHLLPVFNKFINPAKFTVFINAYFILGGAIVLSKIVNRKKTKFIICFITIILMIFHVKNCDSAFYTYKTTEYYNIENVIKEIPDIREHRIFPYAPLRTCRDDISATMVMNFPTFYKIPSIDAYDDKIESLLEDSYPLYSQMHDLKTRFYGKIILQNSVWQYLSEFGVKYLAYHDIKKFGQYVVDISERQNKKIINYINENLKKVYTENNSIIFYEIPNPKPLAFDEKISPLPIEFNTQGAIVDISGVKTSQNVTVNMIWRKYYTAYIDNQIQEIHKDKYNRMVVFVPRNKDKLTIKYHSPWEKGALLMLIMLIIFAPITYIFYKKVGYDE